MAILQNEYGVGCVVANPPIHTTIPFIREHTAGQELPLSEELGARLFCVAIHPCMTEQENEYIAAALWEAVERVRKET
jgi:dTDP-4-amino-4,6-dideoxygalactose transaminase